MKDKEKQIEEIEITENAIRESENDDKIYMLYNELELLIQSLGYQKVDKDSVILTKAELNQIQANFFDSGIKYSSKETASEIFEKIKQALNHLDNEWEISNALYLIEKQYGVDLGEEQ